MGLNGKNNFLHERIPNLFLVFVGRWKGGDSFEENVNYGQREPRAKDGDSLTLYYTAAEEKKYNLAQVFMSSPFSHAQFT